MIEVDSKIRFIKNMTFIKEGCVSPCIECRYFRGSELTCIEINGNTIRFKDMKGGHTCSCPLDQLELDIIDWKERLSIIKSGGK